MARYRICTNCLEIYNIPVPDSGRCICGGFIVLPEKKVVPKDHYAALNTALLMKVSADIPVENMH